MVKSHATLKSVMAIVILGATFFFAYLPFLSPGFRKNKTLISLANSLAGGVFLSAGLIHILPDAQEAWEKATKGSQPDKGEPFPTVAFTILCSFSAILLLDRVLLPGHHGHAHGHDEGHHEHGHGHGHEHHAHGSVADSHKDEKEQRLQEADGEHQAAPALGPYMLVVAMGVHATFEGLALGLMDSTAGFTGFLMAILLHKWAEALAIGISFLKSDLSKFKIIVSLLVFSSLTPLGVFLGIVFDGADPHLKAILLSVSCGTFLYISIAEILAEEFASSKQAGIKYGAYLLGAAVMVGVWYIEQLTDTGDDNDD